MAMLRRVVAFAGVSADWGPVDRGLAGHELLHPPRRREEHQHAEDAADEAVTETEGETEEESGGSTKG